MSAAKAKALTFVAAPASWAPAKAGRKVVLGAGVSSKKALLAALARGLGLAPHFGHNWDALEESLREFSWSGGAPSISIVHEALPQVGEEDLRVYLDILASSIAELRASKDAVPEVTAVFPEGVRKEVAKLLK